MEGLIALLVIAVLGTILLGGILGIVAFFRGSTLGRALATCEQAIESLLDRVARLERLLPEEAPAQAPPAGVEEPSPEEPAPPQLLPEEPPVDAVHRLRLSREGAEAPSPTPDTAAPLREPAEPAPLERGREWWEDLEQKLGKQWMAWAGALVLFLAAGFFVKLAIDRGWIGPTARVVAGIVMGVVLLLLGERSMRRKMRALGQALMGGGLAILYLSLFAASSPHAYDLMPREAGFAAMVLVTAAGMTLAVLHNALPTSFLALLGGLLTPVLLSTGEDARDALFAYLVVLNLGVLGVALFRRWRALDTLAFVGTAALFTGWFLTFYEDPAMVPTLLWLGAFYLTFLVLPFAYHLRHGTPITLERFLMAVANAALAFACAYKILSAEHRHVLGFVALGMAGCYIVLGSLSRRRIAADARGMFGFVALSVILLTMAVPLHLKLHGITLAWAVEGPVLLYLGYRYRYLPVRIGGFIVLVLATLRLFTVHWPLHTALFVPIWNRHFASALLLPLALAAFALVHHWRRGESRVADHRLKLASAICAGFLGLIVLHAELGLWLRYSEAAYLGRCVAVLVWAVGSAAFLGAGMRTRCLRVREAGLGALAVALVLTARLYSRTPPEGYLLFFNARFAVALLAALVVFAQGYVLRRRHDVCAGEQGRARFLYQAGGLILLFLLSAETYGYCRQTVSPPSRARWMALMSLSVVWGVYAAAALALGIRKRVRPLRFAALGLFGITAAKLVLVDIAGVKQIYRVISFFVLGLLMMGGAYLYHRVEKWLAETNGEDQ